MKYCLCVNLHSLICPLSHTPWPYLEAINQKRLAWGPLLFLGQQYLLPNIFFKGTYVDGAIDPLLSYIAQPHGKNLSIAFVLTSLFHMNMMAGVLFAFLPFFFFPSLFLKFQGFRLPSLNFWSMWWIYSIMQFLLLDFSPCPSHVLQVQGILLDPNAWIISHTIFKESYEGDRKYIYMCQAKVWWILRSIIFGK